MTQRRIPLTPQLAARIAHHQRVFDRAEERLKGMLEAAALTVLSLEELASAATIECSGNDLVVELPEKTE